MGKIMQLNTIPSKRILCFSIAQSNQLYQEDSYCYLLSRRIQKQQRSNLLTQRGWAMEDRIRKLINIQISIASISCSQAPPLCQLKAEGWKTRRTNWVLQRRWARWPPKTAIIQRQQGKSFRSTHQASLQPLYRQHHLANIIEEWTLKTAIRVSRAVRKVLVPQA